MKNDGTRTIAIAQINVDTTVAIKSMDDLSARMEAFNIQLKKHEALLDRVLEKQARIAAQQTGGAE